MKGQRIIFTKQNKKRRASQYIWMKLRFSKITKKMIKMKTLNKMMMKSQYHRITIKFQNLSASTQFLHLQAGKATTF